MSRFDRGKTGRKRIHADQKIRAPSMSAHACSGTRNNCPSVAYAFLLKDRHQGEVARPMKGTDKVSPRPLAHPVSEYTYP